MKPVIERVVKLTTETSSSARHNHSNSQLITTHLRSSPLTSDHHHLAQLVATLVKRTTSLYNRQNNVFEPKKIYIKLKYIKLNYNKII
jgi:hypothetical protein